MRSSSRTAPRFGMLFGVLAAAAGALALPGVAGAQAPAQDSVVLTGGPAVAGSITVIALNATSGPSGENPTGEVRFFVSGVIPVGGPVTCLAVNGNTATIDILDEASGLGVVTIQVVDGQPDFFDAFPPVRDPVGRPPPPPLGPGGPVSGGGDITVVDARPFPIFKDHCKNGGWAQFGFKNQGQCVAFVQRGPKP
jgi:hypothetical protein